MDSYIPLIYVSTFKVKIFIIVLNLMHCTVVFTACSYAHTNHK